MTDVDYQMTEGIFAQPLIENIPKLRKNRRPLSEKEKARLRTLRIGLPSAMKGVYGKDHHCSKPIYCVELDRTFDSAREAEKYLRANGFPKASSSSIGSCCRGEPKRLKAYGFTWRVIKDGVYEVLDTKNVRDKPVYCLELNLTFPSGASAARYLKDKYKKQNKMDVIAQGINSTCRKNNLRQQLNSQIKLRASYGYTWLFA